MGPPHPILIIGKNHPLLDQLLISAWQYMIKRPVKFHPPLPAHNLILKFSAQYANNNHKSKCDPDPPLRIKKGFTAKSVNP